MQTAPCRHCGTPNGTNLVACYFCGRRLAAGDGIISDDLPDYDSPQVEESYPRIVGAVSGFVALLSALILIGFLPFGLLVVALHLNVVIFVVIAYVLFAFCLALAGFIPLYFQIFWNLGVTYGPKIGLKFTKWCGELRTHCHKVRAGQI